MLPPNSSKDVTFSYRLPRGITSDGYTLRVQRQAGTKALPIRVTINGVERTATLTSGAWQWQ